MHGGLADVHAEHVLVQRLADQLPSGLRIPRPLANQPAQRLHQEHAGAASQVQHGLVAGALVQDLVQDQRNQRQARVVHILLGSAGCGVLTGLGELLVDGADEFDRDDVELIREQRRLAGGVHGVEEAGHPAELVGFGNAAVAGKHVAVEGVAKPVEQSLGRAPMAQDFRQRGTAASTLEEVFGDDSAIHQVLHEDRAADQALRVGPVHAGVRQFARQPSDVAEQEAIYAAVSIEPPAHGILPEAAGLHGQAASGHVEFPEFASALLERSDAVSVGVGVRFGLSEPVVDVDLGRRDHPEQGREAFVPHLLTPLRNRSRRRRGVFVLEVDLERRPAAPCGVGLEVAGAAGVAGVLFQRQVVGHRPGGSQVPSGLQNVVEWLGGHHDALPIRKVWNSTMGKPLVREW